MSFFGRRRGRETAAAPVADPRTAAFARCFIDFTRLAAEQHVKADHVDVVADFGALMEKNAGNYHVHPESELPYPIDLIRRAQDVALNDPLYEPVRPQLDAAISDLENYVADEDFAPYRFSADAFALFMRTIASPEFQRLLASDADAALAMTGSLPDGTTERLAPLDRLLRRRRTARWSDLRQRLPHLFSDDDNETAFELWMLAHAADVHTVASETREQLHRAERGQPDQEAAARAFRERLQELGQLSDEGLAYAPVPQSCAERADIYRSVLARTSGSLHDVVRAELEGREADSVEAQKRFEEMLGILARMKEQSKEVSAMLAQRFLERRREKGEAPAGPAGRGTTTTARQDAVRSDPKGRIEDLDDDGDG